MTILKRVIKKLKEIIYPHFLKFDRTGERIDIFYAHNINFEELDMYQKSHYSRYEYALKKIAVNDICGDFACGTGYGSVMLADKAQKVIGADINNEVINAIQKRYKKVKNVQFINIDLLNISFQSELDAIISFETIEHFTEENILKLLHVFNKCLKVNGRLIISTPYKQERSEAAINLGHHLTFHIDKDTIVGWLTSTGFKLVNMKYQNYDTHVIEETLEKKDFIICEAQKIN